MLRPSAIPLLEDAVDQSRSRSKERQKSKIKNLTPRQLWGHFARTLLASFFAIMTTLLIGAFFGPLNGVGTPDIGISSALMAAMHLFAFATLFSIVRRAQEGIRVNPYITLVEFFLNRGINAKTLVVELLGQVLGAVGATGLVYGVVADTAGFIPGIGGTIINTKVGWAFALALLAGFLLGFVYFQNYMTAQNFPFLFALTIVFSMVFTLPFLGPTTHNPYRWLGACIIESSCGASGSWVYPVGPVVGIVLGFIFQKVTRQ